jgi:hypothetical protein
MSTTVPEAHGSDRSSMPFSPITRRTDMPLIPGNGRGPQRAAVCAASASSDRSCETCGGSKRVILILSANDQVASTSVAVRLRGVVATHMNAESKHSRVKRVPQVALEHKNRV